MSSRPKAVTAAVLLAGTAVLGASAPALAQVSGAGATAAGTSDDTAVLNQTLTITTGDNECPPAQPAAVVIEGRGFRDTDSTTADSTGTATIQYTVPSEAQPGRASATFACAANTVVVPFTVVAAAAASPGRGQLPRTGSDNLVPLALGGAAMVAVGGAIVVAARRRREPMPGSFA